MSCTEHRVTGQVFRQNAGLKRTFETWKKTCRFAAFFISALHEIVELGPVARWRWWRGNHRSGRIEPLPSAGVVVGELDGV